MLYLGIDFGTTGVRTGLYEKNGNEIAFSSVAYDTFSIKPSYAEQHPYDWWEALGTATKDLLKKSKVHPEDIASLAVDFHSCSVMLCSKTGEPLRDCIIWMDVRAASESDEINEITGESLSPEWMPAKLLWLKRNESYAYDKAEVFCEE